MKAKEGNKTKPKTKEKEQIDSIFQSTMKSQKSNVDAKEVGILTLLQEKGSNSYRKKDLGDPTGRREVELLNEWLDKMLNAHVFSK